MTAEDGATAGRLSIIRVGSALGSPFLFPPPFLLQAYIVKGAAERGAVGHQVTVSAAKACVVVRVLDLLNVKDELRLHLVAQRAAHMRHGGGGRQATQAAAATGPASEALECRTCSVSYV